MAENLEIRQMQSEIKKLLGVGDNTPTTDEVLQVVMFILSIIANVRDDVKSDVKTSASNGLTVARRLVNELNKKNTAEIKDIKARIKKIKKVNEDRDLDLGVALQLAEANQASINKVRETIKKIKLRKPKDGKPGRIPKHEWNGTMLRFQNPDGSWGEYVNLQGVPGVGDGGGWGSSSEIPIKGGSGITVRKDASGAWVISSSGSGSSQTIEVPTGTVNDSNTDFTFAEKPFLIVVNGATYRENNGWSWSSPVATLDFPVGTDGDVYGIMQ